MINEEVVIEILKLVKKQVESDKQTWESMKILEKRLHNLEDVVVRLNSATIDLKLDLARQDGLSEKDIN